MTGTAIYLAVGVTLAAACFRGYLDGRLRWYNLAAAVVAWPVVLIAGVFYAFSGRAK